MPVFLFLGERAGLMSGRGCRLSMKIKNDKDSIAVRVADVAEPLCLAENFELVHVQCLSEYGGMIIRISVDKPGGITLEDCIDLNHQLGDLIDVHLDDLGAYRLEISSPGPNRPLIKETDFERFKGRRVRIELSPPMDGRRRFTGVLRGIQDGVVQLAVDLEVVQIQFEQISKARLSDAHGE